MKKIEIDPLFATVFRYGYKKQTLIASFDGEADESIQVSCGDLTLDTTFAGATLVSLSGESMTLGDAALDEGQRARFAVKEGFENYEKMHTYYSEKLGANDGFVNAYVVYWK